MKLKSILMGRKILQSFFERLYRVCLRGMNYGNGAYIESSGEIYVIEELSHILENKSFVTVFDVGSNDGEYLSHFLKHFRSKSFTVHCFEPSKFAFEKLNEKYGRTPTVILNNFGLGESNATLELFYNEKGSTMATLYRSENEKSSITFKASEKVIISTVEDYCSKNNIDSIDFMKIDVEGHEISVLKGAASLISNGKINIIQFEIGPSSLTASTYLRQFFAVLDEYSIYRILQDGLQKIDYDERYEIFLTTNYLAIRNGLVR